MYIWLKPVDMKKFFRILLIALGIILILLITVPILFKSRIEDFVKQQINQNIHATVEWSRFSLTLLRGFPDLSVNLHQVSVTGLEPFDGDTLVALERFEFRVNPFSAIRKDIQVKSILLNHPLINGIVLEDGTANWDITAQVEDEGEGTGVGIVAEEGEPSIEDQSQEAAQEMAGETESSTKEPATSMGFTLKRFAIRNGRIFYNDAAMGLEASMEDFNMKLSGDFSMDETELGLELGINGINAKYGGIRYIRDGKFSLDLIAAADMTNNVYTLQKNEIGLNGLVLGADGMVSMLDGGAMEMDLKIFSRETSFHTLLSMVPAIYLKDFESLKTSGNLELTGSIKGMMKDTILPDATLNLKVTDGYFAYPDLPKDVSDVQIVLNVDYRGTDMDLTRVNLDRFHMLLGGNPFDLNLRADHPVSDMHVAGKMKGVVDFATLQDVVPLEEVQLDGRLDADLSWDTYMSYIENEKFEEVILDGKLLIENVLLNAPDIPVPVQLERMEMNFNPRMVELSTMDMNLGSSDLHLDGELTNFIPYVFDDQTVSGKLNVSSGLLDANEFIPEEETETPDETAGEKAENQEEETGESNDTTLIEIAPPDSLAVPARIKIPENLDFDMLLDLKKVVYDQIVVENISGKMDVKEGVAFLDNLSLDVIQGNVKAKGTIDTRGEFAETDMALDIIGIDIPEAYKTFVTVKRLAPMAGYCKGTANVKMTFRSLLDASFTPLCGTIDGKGRIFTKGLQVHNLKSFVRLSDLLKNEKFREMAPDEVDVKFTVIDGRVIVNPFDINFDDSKITVSGSHGIDLTMDYLLDMNIARSDLGGGINEIMTGITALATGAGLTVPQSDFVKVKANITGTFRNPRITTDLTGNLKSGGKTVVETVKEVAEEKVTEEIEKVEEKVRDEAGEKAEKIISDAEAEAEKIIAEARKAGDKLVNEAERQGENLVKEAGSNPLKQIGAKKAAEELKKQAETRSENLVKEAEVKADTIIERARKEAAKI